MNNDGQPNPYAYKSLPIKAVNNDAFHRNTSKPHGWVGIIAFLLSLFSFFGMFVLIIVAGVVGASNPEIVENETHPFIIVVGLCMIGITMLAVFALAMGIASLFFANQKKLFGILGITFSLLLLGSSVMLFVIGSMS